MTDPDPITPIPGESFNGLVARYAAANWIDRMSELTQLVGISNTRKQNAGLMKMDRLEPLAAAMRLEEGELRARCTPGAGGALKHVLYFGARVHRFDVEIYERRFSPAALRISPYHRADFQLRAFPFSSETWEYLRSHCGRPSCGVRQHWYHTVGIAHCDACGADLREAPAEQVPDHQREALEFALGLVSCAPELRQRSAALVPVSLGEITREDCYELLIRLLPMVEPAFRVRRSQGFWKQSPQEITNAIAKASSMLIGWPDTFHATAADLIAPKSNRIGDGNDGATTAFFRLRDSSFVSAGVNRVVTNLFDSIDLRGPNAKRLREATITIDEIAHVIGKGTAVVAALRRARVIKSIYLVMAGQPVVRACRNDIETIRISLPVRLAPAEAGPMIGITRHGVEQLMTLNALVELDHPFFRARYGCPQIDRRSMEAFRLQLRSACAGPPTDGWQKLDRAMKRIGGRLKPWGPVLIAIANGEIRGSLHPDDAVHSSNILIHPDDARRIDAYSFDRRAFPDFPFSKTMTKSDAGDALNIPPKTHTLLLKDIPTRRGSRALTVDVELVEKHARHYVGTAELAARYELSSQSVMQRMRHARLPNVGLAGYLRRNAEQLLSTARGK